MKNLGGVLIVPLRNAPEMIERFNRFCLHYNLVADAVYKKLVTFKSVYMMAN